MIKKLLASAAMLIAAVNIQAEENPTALWGKAIQTDWTTQGSDIKLAADGSAYIVGGAGTKTTSEYIKFGSDNIAPGTEYNGTSTSGNQMFFLSKVKADGTIAWTVYSKYGEVISNESFVAPVSDGVITFFGIRHVQDFETTSVAFVDAGGNEKSLDWTLEKKYSEGGQRHYRGVIMKVSNEGNIVWLRQIEVNHDGQPAATYAAYKTNTEQGIYPYGVVTDNEGNIYIGGNQRTEFTLVNPDGTTTTKIAARDVEGWNGDSQKSVGDLFVIKLDENGYYLNHLQTEGEATHIAVRSMQFKDGKLYLMGLLTGKEADAAVSLGGKSVTPINAYAGIFTVKMNTDLSVDWFQLYTSTKSGSTMQTPCLYIGKDAIWVLGKMNMQNIGGIEKLSTTLIRAGLLLKVKEEDGAIVDGYIRAVNQAGFFAAYEGEDGYLYAASHVLLNPMILYQFDKTDLSAPQKEWQMIASTADTQGLVMNSDGILYTMTRGNSTSNKLYGETISIGQSTTKYSCNICAFQMPVKEIATGIENINTTSSVKSQNYNVYTISGILVKKAKSQDEAVAGLASGLYIINGKKVVVK